MAMRRPVILGVTGASGTRLGLATLVALLRLGYCVELILTESALLVLGSETGFHPPSPLTTPTGKAALLGFLQLDASLGANLTVHGNKAIGAAPASGTHLTAGMLIVPCSMGSLAKIAHGLSDTLLTRAADVTLKEGRPLVLAPRETPLNAIHLQNMLSLARMGVRLLPPMLSFYDAAFDSIEGQVQHLVGKLLDQLGVEHQLSPRWRG